MIPKILHQIWIQGLDNAPSKLQSYSKKCADVNSDFKHIVWNDISIRELLGKFGKAYLDQYNNYTVPAQKADFARYAILYTYGGIYLDMDMICRRNLAPLLEHNFFCTTDAFFFLSKRYLNGIIGSIPGHKLFTYIFANIYDRIDYSRDVTYSTGTGLLYDSVRQYKRETGIDDIEIIDGKYLHPCQTYDNDSCPYECDSCYVAHTNYGSWNTNLMNYFMRNLKNILFIIVSLIVILIIWFFVMRKTSNKKDSLTDDYTTNLTHSEYLPSASLSNTPLVNK